MTANKECFGFGFNAVESRHHFLIAIPENKNDSVIVYERFSWQEDQEKQTINLYVDDKAKAEISKHKWKLLEEALKSEFNERLKKKKQPAGRFKTGQTPVDKLFGKELLVLVWAVEDSDPSSIPVALRNWRGLAPEERWWLYTMTNAATGNIDDRKGWRKALRYALCENPVGEDRQVSFFDAMIKRGEEH